MDRLNFIIEKQAKELTRTDCLNWREEYMRSINLKYPGLMSLYLLILLTLSAYSGTADIDKAQRATIDPVNILWYSRPAQKWENALPIGNGRLGAMVFGRTDIEKIQFNEETYWSGGPYNTSVKGGYEYLPEIQKLIFEGEYYKAHRIYGRYLMGYPVEQQKYQSTGDLLLKFKSKNEVTNYIQHLELDRGIHTVSYEQDGIKFKREAFVSPVDQVIVVRLTANKPGAISFIAKLNGYRNNAHSNYATDYYRKDGYGQDGLILTGKSADYMGVEGKMRYEARVKAVPEGGKMKVDDVNLIIEKADAVTIYIAAATNFVNYQDVSADQHERNDKVLAALEGKAYQQILTEHLAEHSKYYKRVDIDLGNSENSFLPTDERIKKFDGQNDPNLAALCLQYGRYMLISSSRSGTQPANLQGIWNDKMNPNWDSKYTTNINTEMNYWPAEVGNLTEFSDPLFKMITELTDQGTDVAREHYGKKGWVFHQNTDQWRVAAPMDGVQWGTFTTGGTWLCTHLWEHYLFTNDKEFLAEAYPIMKGNVEFFLDFLIEHPRYGWLVTNPSTSPENFPVRPGDEPFEDEVADYVSTTSICAGSAIDMQLLNDMFTYVASASEILNVDAEFRQKVLSTKAKLAPMQIGKNGDLMEWLEDWDQREDSHRHISNLYGLFPGNQISANKTPKFAEAAKVVLNQRGLPGNGWASAWKMGAWARLYDADKAMENFQYCMNNYTTDSLFSICSGALQVDGMFGLSAVVAEMLLQSHEGELHLLPTLPASWKAGEVRGLCARGGFEIDMSWSNGELVSASVKSKSGKPLSLIYGDKKIKLNTEAGKTYMFKGASLAY